MTDLFLILIGTVLVNNFVLVRFLGLCPFMGVSRNLEAAFGMSMATAFVLTLSSAIAYLLHEFVLDVIGILVFVDEDVGVPPLQFAAQRDLLRTGADIHL